MKKHYFKQKIYEVDRLLNRQCYLEASVAPLQKERQIIKDSLKGATLSEVSLRQMKNKEEKRRVVANKEFSENYWKKLKQRSR